MKKFLVSIALCLVSSCGLQAQILIVSTTKASKNNGSKQWSVSVTPLAGDALLVGCDFNAGTTFVGVSDSAGDSFALIAPEADSPNFAARAYLASNVKGGSTTISCSASSGPPNNEIYVTELKGVSLSAPVDKVQSVAGSTGSATGSLTTTNANEFLWAYVTSGTVTNAKGWTSLSTFDDNLVTSKAQATPGTVSASFSATMDWTLVLVALNPVGVGASAQPISVSISPATSTVQVSQSSPFTATLQNDTLSKGVTWSLSGTGCSGTTCGSLTNVTTTSVTYVAPAAVPTPATVTLRATSVTDSTKSASATITVAPTPPISVSVSPGTATVQVSQSSPFTAVLQNDTLNKGVTWSLSGAGCSGSTCGTLSNATTTSVTYAAPATVPNPASVTLLATSVTDPTKSASATITVAPAPPISVSVSPSTASVQVTQSTPFTASLQNDTLAKGVSWSLSGSGCSGSTCGTLTNVATTSVTYTAPATVPTPATVTLLATSVTDSTKSASATITVAPTPPISVSVSPATATVQVSQSSPFTAVLQNDTLNKGVTWSLSGTGCSGTTCGTLSNVTTTSVTYAAPATVPNPASVTLTATSVADTTKTGTATITVNAAVAQSTISTVGTTQASSNNGSKQWSVGVTPLAGDALLVGCDFNAGTTFVGVSDSAGDSFTLVAPEADSPNFAARAYLASNVKGGSTTVSCSASSGPPNNEIYVTELKGVSLSAPVDKVQSVAGSTGSATGSLTTTNANEFLWAYITSGEVTNASGWTSLSGYDGNLVTSKTQATPAAVQAGFPVTQDWTLVAIALIPSGAGVPAPAISVSVAPSTATVQVLGSISFTATLQNDTLAKGVSWSLSGSGCTGTACGTLTNVTTSSVTYTAPATVPTPATLTLLATSVTDPTKSASTTITVSSAPPISVSVSPATATIQISQTLAFTATLQNDSLNKGVTWSLSGSGCSGAACGTLTSVTTTSVTYTAPAAVPSPATVALQATSIADTTKSSSASITVQGTSATISVTLSPKRGAVTLTQPLQFTATVTGDSQNLGVSWSVDTINGGNSSTGSISSSGLFSPSTSTTPGLHTVTATSVANSTVSASSSIAVTDLPGVFTHHYDPQRTGQNLKEYALSPSTLSSSTFGVLFSCSVNENGTVPGYVYAQPLYVASLTMSDGNKHNVVFVATESDLVYAFDADANPCQQLWKSSMLLSGETTVPDGDTGDTDDLVPEIGVTSTPVIDPSTNTIYICAKSKDSSGNYHHRLHSLSLITGLENANSPAEITATGFDILTHLQRPALLLSGNTVYIAFGSHGDVNVYHGWLMGYDKTALSQSFVWASTDLSSNTEGAIWGAGAGPALDSSGNVWVETANGNFDGSINFGDSVVKLSSSGSLLDFFTPYYQDTLRANDVDLGSGGVLILPTSVGSAAHPNLAVATGKPGGFYLLDQSNLGQFNSSSNNDVQEVFPQGLNTTTIGGGVFGQTAYWNGNLYISVIADSLRQYPISNASIAATSTSNSSETFSYPGVIPAISANINSGGIVWALGIGGYTPGNPVILHAFNATNLASEIYTSPSSGAGAAGTAVKFTVPTVANGKVYVGGQGSITVFGLLPN